VRNTRVRLWLSLAVAILLGVVAALVGLAAAANIVAAGHGGVSLGTDVTLLAISTAVFIACVRWAVHSEHRLRDLPQGVAHIPGAQAPGARSRKADSSRRPRMYHHRHGPVATTFAALIVFGGAIGFTVGSVQAINGWRLSRFVQAHGTLTEATVATVHNIEHQSRSGTWYTADISVLLHTPVGGHFTSTVHDPSAAAYPPGQMIAVRVDPNQPGYSELPGAPDNTVSAFVVLVLFAVIFLVVAALYSRELFIRLRHRYTARTKATAG
jgi:hypothetical protein